MRLWCFAVATLGAWASLVLAGCSDANVAGELTAAECWDGDDNDGDRLEDCADPDCYAFDVCNPETRRPRGQIGDAVTGQAPGTDASTQAPSPLEPPASTPQTSPDPPNEQGEVPADPEAEPGEPEAPPAPATPTTCEPACVAPEMCVEGLCLVPGAIFGDSWQIAALEVSVPRRIESSRCLDGEGAIWCPGGSLNADFLGCGCPPDPQVQVWVISPPEQARLAGSSGAMEKADQGEWTLQTPIPLLLLASSEIVFKVVDQDGEAQEPIFECRIRADPEVLGTGGLSCGQSFTTDRGTMKTYGVEAEVAPVPE